MKPKLFVFGIDGASYKIVTRLMEKKNRLPNLSAIAKQGISGSLKSTFPPHTAPGWASMFTGVEPGEHGIFQFWHTQNPEYTLRTVSVNDFGWEPIWRSLERNGLSVGVINVPMTHPPQALKNGYMISWPLSTTLHYAEPRSLIRELAKAGLHYHSDIVTMYRGQKDYSDLASSYIENRTKTILYLMENRPVDAIFMVYTEIDRISHHYWGYDEEPSYEVEDFYVKIDSALGEIRKFLSKDTLLIVASDHGFGLCRYNLNIHPLLLEAGLANIKLVQDNKSDRVENSDDLAEKNAVNWFTSNHRYYRTIDWGKTYAYMPTPGCFGINLNLKSRESKGIVSSDQVESVVRELRTLFAGLRDPQNNTVFDLVPSKEVYKGDRVKDAPDLIMVPEKWDVMPHPGIELNIWGEPTQQAVHQMDGILFASGPHIPEGITVDARIEDVTPLILAQLGVPIPENITGHWLFDPPFPIRRDPFRLTNNKKCPKLTCYEERLLEQRLAALGYM